MLEGVSNATVAVDCATLRKTNRRSIVELALMTYVQRVVTRMYSFDTLICLRANNLSQESS